eukprot:Sspe_Gene.116906::Locus_107084_Transcript_1_1_Confidence_1.000_Length_372::g.116906::m.116906
MKPKGSLLESVRALRDENTPHHSFDVASALTAKFGEPVKVGRGLCWGTTWCTILMPRASRCRTIVISLTCCGDSLYTPLGTVEFEVVIPKDGFPDVPPKVRSTPPLLHPAVDSL